jgi:hypothetical protein
MKRLPYSGLLLLILGVLALAGYLTGNLDRWLAAAFGSGIPPAPTRPSVASGTTSRPTAVRAA